MPLRMPSDRPDETTEDGGNSRPASSELAGQGDWSYPAGPSAIGNHLFSQVPPLPRPRLLVSGGRVRYGYPGPAKTPN